MSKNTENDYTVYASDQNGQKWINIIVALLVVAVTIVVFLYLRGKSISRRGICLIGLCDSGKTLLFCQIIFKKAMETFTSMKENTGTLQIEQKKPLEIIDIPGHERVRQRFFDNYKHSARGIIYIIDSLNFTKDIRDVAEYLYTILLDQVITSNCPKILIFCNKQDYPLAKGKQVIKVQLEKEMNVLRTTKANQLQATSDSGDKVSFLGDEGKDFEFSDLHSLRIDFAMGSAQGGELDEVTKWISSLA